MPHSVSFSHWFPLLQLHCPLSFSALLHCPSKMHLLLLQWVSFPSVCQCGSVTSFTSLLIWFLTHMIPSFEDLICSFKFLVLTHTYTFTLPFPLNPSCFIFLYSTYHKLSCCNHTYLFFIKVSFSYLPKLKWKPLQGRDCCLFYSLMNYLLELMPVPYYYSLLVEWMNEWMCGWKIETSFHYENDNVIFLYEACKLVFMWTHPPSLCPVIIFLCSKANLSTLAVPTRIYLSK